VFPCGSLRDFFLDGFMGLLNTSFFIPAYQSHILNNGEIEKGKKMSLENFDG
jgi:hypothetical protein